MPELSELAEWLGVEVIDVEGEAVLRYRQKDGQWMEREQRATAEEGVLYDALRGMVATQAQSAHALLLKAVAEAAGLGNESRSMRVLAEIKATRMSREDWRKKADKNHDIIVDLRRQLKGALNLPRLTPKGGDRNELARQVRRTAHAVVNGQAGPYNEEFVQGVVKFANTVLHMLGEEPMERREGQRAPTLDVPSEQDVWVQAIEQLRADRWQDHAEGSRAFYLHSGEAHAFALVLQLLKTGTVEL